MFTPINKRRRTNTFLLDPSTVRDAAKVLEFIATMTPAWYPVAISQDKQESEDSLYTVRVSNSNEGLRDWQLRVDCLGAVHVNDTRVVLDLTTSFPPVDAA